MLTQNPVSFLSYVLTILPITLQALRLSQRSLSAVAISCVGKNDHRTESLHRESHRVRGCSIRSLSRIELRVTLYRVGKCKVNVPKAQRLIMVGVLVF